jgi:hypothetical protein
MSSFAYQLDLKFETYQSESPNENEHISSRATYRLVGQGLGLADVVDHATTVGSWVDTYAADASQSQALLIPLIHTLLHKVAVIGGSS